MRKTVKGSWGLLSCSSMSRLTLDPLCSKPVFSASTSSCCLLWKLGAMEEIRLTKITIDLQQTMWQTGRSTQAHYMIINQELVISGRVIWWNYETRSMIWRGNVYNYGSRRNFSSFKRVLNFHWCFSYVFIISIWFAFKIMISGKQKSQQDQKVKER